MMHVALLRAINVGGHARVPMADLRALLIEAGFAAPQTLLHSGNVVVETGRLSGAKLEAFLEDATQRRFGHRPDYMVRTAAQWDALVEANPFTAEANADPARVFVMTFKSALRQDRVSALRAAIRGSEVIAAAGRELYAFYPDGMGTSRLTNVVIERTLGVRATARNWNTVLKLRALLRAAPLSLTPPV